MHCCVTCGVAICKCIILCNSQTAYIQRMYIGISSIRSNKRGTFVTYIASYGGYMCMCVHIKRKYVINNNPMFKMIKLSKQYYI